jgi:K+-sensing histidine kinase KdpD
MTDPGVFTNVFYCLVHNAMKYADRGSTAVLGSTLHEAPALLELYLETTGEPILVQERDSIFEKAVRGSAVRKGRHHSGVGLGLWIAKGLATLVGGGLCLAPGGEDPRVSRFVVGLPIDWTPPN